MAKKNYRKGGSSNTKRKGSSKNMRRDVEIMDTSRRELAADARERRDCYRSQDNDWTWYAQTPQLVRDYASYPFGVPLGSRLSEDLGSGFGDGSIPGVLALYYSPSVGNPQDANAPVNIAARNIYSFVRHANSGHSNYDAPDLMLYLLAMDSVYMMHSYMKRIMGMMYNYTPENRYYPAAVVSAMGVDPDDVASHLSDFRGFINQYAVKMGSMCVPNSMSYMARHTWMTEGIYVDDGSTAKAQTYMYVPWQFYQFGYDGNGAGQLQLATLWKPYTNAQTDYYQAKPQALLKVSDVINFANSLLDPILANEDLNIMSGDILKAFGSEGVVKAAGIAEGYMVLPQYSQEVLSQIENATIFHGVTSDTISQNVEVGGGYLYSSGFGMRMITPYPNTFASNPAIVASGARRLAGYLINDGKLLNFHHSNPTPEEVMVATRLTNTYSMPSTIQMSTDTNFGALTMTMNLDAAGSEIVNFAVMYNYTWSGVTMSLSARYISTMMFAFAQEATDTSNTASRCMSAASRLTTSLGMLSMFDWHPMVTFATCTVPSTATAASVGSYYGVNVLVGDVSNYTVVDRNNLINMHAAALLSEFSVPQMGAFSQKV